VKVPAAVALLAALVLAPAGAVGAATIRVAVLESARAVELRGTSLEVSGAGACPRCPSPMHVGGADVLLRIVWRDGGIEIDGEPFGRVVRVRSDAPIRVNGREYAGTFELVRSGDGLAVINELPLETYVAGALKAEASETWPREALRAQAIVIRTYAAYQRQLSAGRPYHIVASTAHQLYAGRVADTSPLWDAVRDTTGLVLRWEGALFAAFYHTDDGGYTESPQAVFAAKNLPALRPVRCQYASGPHFHWALDLRLTELSETLRRAGLGVGAVTGIDVTERSESLRVADLVVHGTRGSAHLRGSELRRLVGYDTLKSTLFAVAVDEQYAHFSGRGWGHGVGMCQAGAAGMAQQGYTAAQILEYFYGGTTLSALPEP
jgi:stage II sporulation protein D (peptidoglycan lytic transglycosylase)